MNATHNTLRYADMLLERAAAHDPAASYPDETLRIARHCRTTAWLPGLGPLLAKRLAEEADRLGA